MKIGLSENFTNKITNALKENERNRKSMKEDNYESGIFFEIETALYEAGLQPSRFSDDGMLTNNLGWTVTSPETGETQQLECCGSWLDESLKEMEFPPKEEKEVTRDELLKKKEELKREYMEAKSKHDRYWPDLVAEDIMKINRLIDGAEKEAIIRRTKYKLKESTDLSEEGFDTWNGFKNELRNNQVNIKTKEIIRYIQKVLDTMEYADEKKDVLFNIKAACGDLYDGAEIHLESVNNK